MRDPQVSIVGSLLMFTLIGSLASEVYRPPSSQVLSGSSVGPFSYTHSDSDWIIRINGKTIRLSRPGMALDDSLHLVDRVLVVPTLSGVDGLSIQGRMIWHHDMNPGLDTGRLIFGHHSFTYFEGEPIGSLPVTQEYKSKIMLVSCFRVRDGKRLWKGSILTKGRPIGFAANSYVCAARRGKTKFMIWTLLESSGEKGREFHKIRPRMDLEYLHQWFDYRSFKLNRSNNNWIMTFETRDRRPGTKWIRLRCS